MTFLKILLLCLAYMFGAFLYGVAGPTANIEGGQSDQYWWEAPFWPLGLLYRLLKAIGESL